MGVMQDEAKAADLGKFCWVKRSGLTPVLCDGSARDLGLGDNVVPTGGGLVQSAYASSPTVAQAAAATRGAIGKAAVATSYTDSQDFLALIDLDIPTGPLSYNFSDDENGYNLVTIR